MASTSYATTATASGLEQPPGTNNLGILRVANRRRGAGGFGDEDNRGPRAVEPATATATARTEKNKETKRRDDANRDERSSGRRSDS